MPIESKTFNVLYRKNEQKTKTYEDDFILGLMNLQV